MKWISGHERYEQKQKRQAEWHNWPFAWWPTTIMDNTYWLASPPYLRRRTTSSIDHGPSILTFTTNWEWRHITGEPHGAIIDEYRIHAGGSTTCRNFRIAKPDDRREIENIVEFRRPSK